MTDDGEMRRKTDRKAAIERDKLFHQQAEERESRLHEQAREDARERQAEFLELQQELEE